VEQLVGRSDTTTRCGHQALDYYQEHGEEVKQLMGTVLDKMNEPHLALA
jgi:hypothetical protein